MIYLMAAPAGLRATMGLDPGLRTGVTVAVVDATGKLVATDTFYPHTGQADKAAAVVAALCLKHHVELVAIGNGTASRKTERFHAAGGNSAMSDALAAALGKRH